MSVRSQTWLREIYGIQLCNVTWIIANIHEMSANFCSHATDDMLMLNDLVIIKPFTLWSHDNSFRHIYSHLSYSNILNCVILKLPPVAQNVQMQKKYIPNCQNVMYCLWFQWDTFRIENISMFLLSPFLYCMQIICSQT